jgi:hypothetical protein
MTAAFKWSLLAACIFAVTGASAQAQTNPPDPAAPPPSDVPPPSDAPPPPPPPPLEATTALPQAPMAPTPATAGEPPIVPAAQAPFKVETPSKSNIKFGLLLQPQFQALQAAPGSDGYAYNLYLRRARVLLGGTLFGVVDYFFDTDFANLFLANNTGVMGMPADELKATPGMNIQDAFITYRPLADHKPLADLIKIDAGYMLPPLAHNAVQGATTLYSWDYFAYTFLSGNSFGTTSSPVGRDLGVQLRGLVLDGHIEYRVGLFQGLRVPQTATEAGARNFFRATGRVQINLLDPETGFFYAGSYLGTKKILSIGGSADLQDDYKYFAGDAFADMTLGPGVLTAQVNLAYWNGNTFIPTLPKQTALMGEVGYLIGAIRLSPIFRAEQLWVTNANNQTRLGGGVAFWPFGHNTNIKAFYTNFNTENAARAVNQFNVQWQLYFF